MEVKSLASCFSQFTQDFKGGMNRKKDVRYGRLWWVRSSSFQLNEFNARPLRLAHPAHVCVPMLETYRVEPSLTHVHNDQGE